MKTYDLDVKCYEVTQPSGDGVRSEHLAYFSSRSVAIQYADATNKKWPKNVREVNLRYRYVVCDTIEDKELYDLDCIKQTALAKLTDKEKEVLGLTK